MAIMEIILFWLGLAIIVGVAGNTRGRSGLAWFLLSLLITPILTGLLLLALPKIEPQAERRRTGPFTKTSSMPGRAARTEGPFLPDGVLGGIPYRVLPGGLIDAVMSGGIVRFRDMEQLLAAINGKSDHAAK